MRVQGMTWAVLVATALSGSNASAEDASAPVGIVAGCAGEAIAGRFLALALEQRFPLAGGASGRSFFILMDEELGVVEQVIAGPVVLGSFPEAIHGDFAFEVAGEADGIAADRRERVEFHQRFQGGPALPVRRAAFAGRFL